ncbi:PepSY-associated TM helix domain-containing protein [Neobacillus pocheonensis]|uniref:PepSY-associated TM helix domain-containing protein n=1 Tax=Neobacillus pocheonensis TaxID=363869 RepID=UPI003D2751EC
MKKMRKAHLWIGLICSIFILMESITGLLMNEPWLIGQTQTERMGNFQPGQMPGINGDSSQASGQTQSQTNGQTQPNTNNQSNGNSQDNTSGQTQGQTGAKTNGQFPGQGGRGAFGPGGENSQGSFMSIIKGLHEGRIGTTNIKWLIDLTAIAMIFLTGSGIYLSIKVLGVKKRKKDRMENEVA